MAKAEELSEQERFAAELRELRIQAGSPSFRTMAAASSRTVSHATLHEATAGTRFPSWTTTRAFVVACGGDEQSWHARWLAARTPSSPTPERPLPPETPPPEPRRRPTRLILPAAATAAAIIAAPFLWPDDGSADDPPTATAQPVTAPSQPDGPLIEGDASAFIADRTIPDGTVVRPGHRFLKIWEIANTGKAHWKHRYLERIPSPKDNGTCSTPGKVEIPDTPAGHHALIKVPVTPPTTPGSCWVAWKMTDPTGHPYFPTSRPLFFTITVSA